MRRISTAALLSVLVGCGGGSAPTQPPPPPPPPSTQPGPPASVTVQAGDGQQAEPGKALPIKPAVLVKDASGRPVPGISVGFAIDSGGGTVAAAGVTTGGDGIATADWTLGPADGPAVLIATVSGLPAVRIRATGKFPMLTLLDAAVVPASGGTVAYTKQGDPFSGVSVTVPDATFPDATTFSVQVDRNTHPALPADVKQIGPAFLISDGKGFGDFPMAVRLPITAGGDTVLAAFLYDPSTGTLESAPMVARDAGSITIASRHFSADQLLPIGRPASLRSQAPAAPPAFGAVYVMAVATTPARLSIPLTTGFVPGTDDWEFTNYGTYAGKGGICSGMSVTALYYYYKYRPAGKPLNHQFDTFANLEFDNPRGERLASDAQNGANWQNAQLWLQQLTTYAQASAVPYPQLVYQSLALTIKVTHQPQFLALVSPIPFLGGHAVVAYGVNNGAVLFADPNQPGVSGLSMHYANGAFAPVQLSTDASQPPSNFTNISMAGVTSMVRMTTLDGWWAKFLAGTSGNGIFPAIQREMFDQTSDAWVAIPASGVITTPHRILALRTICPGCRPFRSTIPKTRAMTALKDTINVTRGLDLLDTDTAAVMVFGKGAGSFRISMESFWPDVHGFLDQQWLTIVSAPVTIDPAPATGPVSADLTFTLHHFGLATPGTTFVWDFDDGTPKVTKSVDSTVVHHWSSTGVYTITAEVQTAGGKRLAVDQTTVTIFKAIAPAPAVGASNSDINFMLHHGGLAGAGATFTWDFGDKTTPVTKTVDSTVVHQWKSSGVFTLTAKVRDAGGKLLIQDQTTVIIDGVPSIKLVITGNWNLSFTPGNYAFSSFVGLRLASPTPGLDAIFWSYDLAGNSSGVLVTMLVPTGSTIAVGQTFTRFVLPHPGAGQFQLTLSQDLSNPATSPQQAPVGAGTLTIVAIGRQPNGIWVAQYSFDVLAPNGAKITATGVAKWQ